MDAVVFCQTRTLFCVGDIIEANIDFHKRMQEIKGRSTGGQVDIYGGQEGIQTSFVR